MGRLSEAPSIRAGLTGQAGLLSREVASRRAGLTTRARPVLVREDQPRRGTAPLSIAMISNPRSHRNGGGLRPVGASDADIRCAAPDTKSALDLAIADFEAHGVDTIIINGGDGTVRDVISAVRRIYTGVPPTFAILPSGKTNAIAIDLGIPADISLDTLVEAIRSGSTRERTPLEVSRDGTDAPDLSGFLFGAGAFVKATELAQTTHRFGAFNGMAVALSLVGSITQTMFGAKDRGWRAGDAMRIGGDVNAAGRFYLLLCSTLDRLPLGLKPFGKLGEGMKLLAVDAPPRAMLRRVPMLLAGVDDDGMKRAGYHHHAAETLDITLDGNFILDGETYEGRGKVTLRRGSPLEFVVLS